MYSILIQVASTKKVDIFNVQRQSFFSIPLGGYKAKSLKKWKPTFLLFIRPEKTNKQ